MLLGGRKRDFRRIFPILICIAFILLIEAVNFYLLEKGIFFWRFQVIITILEKMIIALIAGFYGPIAGFIIGFLGKPFGIIQIILSMPTGYGFEIFLTFFFSFLKYGLYGLCIGFFWKKYNFSADKILMKNILLFCLVQIISDLIFLEILDMVIDNYSFMNIDDRFISILYFITKYIQDTLLFIIFLLIYKKIKNRIRLNVV